MISFGNIVGSTRLVEADRGVQFLQAASTSGLDFIIPATGEFMFGVSSFRMLAAYPGMPEFISANVVDERTRTPLVDPYAIWNVSGLRICLIGISDTEIINKSSDRNVVGIDVIPYNEVLEGIKDSVFRERPDIVILAGCLDRASILGIAKKYRFIDAFVTFNKAGGFTREIGATRSVLIADKPVYIASENSASVCRLAVSYGDGIETREFTEATVKDMTPREDVFTDLNTTLEGLEQQDREENIIVATGVQVAEILRKTFDVDVAAFERDCLFYFPLEDSLSLVDIRKIVKPGKNLTTFTLKGARLKSAWEKSRKATDSSLKLHFGGITPEGKIDDIPIQDEREYTVATTVFLRQGGLGYREFREGAAERIIAADMLGIAEDYLVAKDERIRIAEKEKIWTLALNLSLGSNINKTDVDQSQSLYGSSPPKDFRNLNDLFTGYFSVSSWDDKFNVKYKRHVFESKLRARYLRSGLKSEDGSTSYKEGGDDLQLYNKYTYDLEGFKTKPFAAVDIYSEFYSPAGRHPVSASARTGLSREIQKLWNLVVEVGLDGTRNYVTNENTFGTTNKFILSKSLPAKGLFTTPTKISVDAQMTWNPMAKYNMAFYMFNNNRVEFQLWKKLNLTFYVKSYAYRNTTQRKLSLGFIYDLTLNYKMDWNF